jgi:hypothetical protein
MKYFHVSGKQKNYTEKIPYIHLRHFHPLMRDQLCSSSSVCRYVHLSGGIYEDA